MCSFICLTFWFLSQLVSWVVEATNNVKHVTTNLLGQAKRLQIGQKNANAAARAIERARIIVEKALKEVNAHIAAMKIKLSIRFAEKDTTD